MRRYVGYLRLLLLVTMLSASVAPQTAAATATLRPASAPVQGPPTGSERRVAALESNPAPVARFSSAESAKAPLAVDTSGVYSMVQPSSAMQQTEPLERPQVVYENNFESGAAGSVWSNQTITTSPTGRRFLGRFSNTGTTLNLANLPSHSRLTISFDLYIINSWDGNNSPGPDRWQLSLDGASLIDTTFGTDSAIPQCYPANCSANNPGGTGRIEADVLLFDSPFAPFRDSVYRITLSSLHSSSSAVFDFRGIGLQDVNDESWGLDNLQVRVGRFPGDQDRNADCANQCSPTYHWPHPVNTRTGNFWHQTTDIQVESAGPPIVWTRTYNSQALTETTALGAGWQHPYASRLLLPTMAGGEAGRIIVVSPTGNRLRFDGPTNGPYSAWPGIYSTLVKSGTTFVQTLRDQTQYTFRESDGLLTTVRDPQGRTVNLQYDATVTNRLTRVQDAANSGRYLQLTYSSGRITAVSDGTRSVSYGYGTNSNLTSVRDVRGATTTYIYQTPANNLLTTIRNPLGQNVEVIGYTGSPPRVASQTLQDGRSVAFGYTSATTVITSTNTDGRIEVLRATYAGDGTLRSVVNATPGAPDQLLVDASFDHAFAPSIIRDGNGSPTVSSFTAAGRPTTMINALNKTTTATYNNQNFLTEMTDPLGVKMRRLYDTYNNVISTTTGISSTNALPLTTLYRYQYRQSNGTWGTNAANAVDSRLHEITRPDGVIVRYAYDATHPLRVVSVTVAPGTSFAQVTAYTYDPLGRVENTTVASGSALARTTRTEYNPDNSVRRVIENYKDGTFTASRPDEDLITTYGYDRLGRTIAVTDTLGFVDVTRYNVRGQVEATAQNVTSYTRDASGQPVIPAFALATPDRNIAIRFGYDGLGRTTLVTETGILTGTFDTATLRFSSATTRVTRTEYDTRSRPITTTLNFLPGLSPTPDSNLQLLTQYDDAGNVVRERDVLGRWTAYQYNALNQPIRIIQNFQDGIPTSNEPDIDIAQVMVYDAAGRLIQQIEALPDFPE